MQKQNDDGVLVWHTLLHPFCCAVSDPHVSERPLCGYTELP